MGNLNTLVRNIESVPDEALRKASSQLVAHAIAERDAHLFGTLVDRLGLPLNGDVEGVERELYDQYIAERPSAPPVKLTTPSLRQPKTYAERRGTFIASTVGAFRKEIPRIAKILGVKPENGYSKMRKPDLKRVYWSLRFRAEEADLM